MQAAQPPGSTGGREGVSAHGRDGPGHCQKTGKSAPGSLFPFDLHDFVRLGAAWRNHLDLCAFLLADQRARERRGNGNLAFLSVASGSPTICHTVFLSVSSSIKVTVAPKVMVSPESFDTSITSARASLSSSSAMRPSLIDWVSFAA